MPKEIIGLVGLKGSGKSSVGNVLKKLGYLHISFAESLKEIVAAALEIPIGHLTDQEYKEKPLPQWGNALPRDFLQKVGTEGFRAVDPYFWIKKLFNKITNYETNFGQASWYIDDVRFSNEIEAIARSPGGRLALVDMVGKALPFGDVHDSERASLFLTQQYRIKGHADLVVAHGGTLPRLMISPMVFQLVQGRIDLDEEIVNRALNV